jgi:hypothetical protein
MKRMNNQIKKIWFGLQVHDQHKASQIPPQAQQSGISKNLSVSVAEAH